MNKKSSKPIMKRTREQVADSLKLPKDFILGASMTSITGCEEAFIENYKGIIEICSNSVMLQTKTCRMHFIGTNLAVDYYTDEEMKITGHIEQIHFFE
ncbi:MAG: YabP/YqfC family sporulation protein [Lachnospiraceae bacterium]|nr:YabP/YqfC family sporulation protein [Lachnospiraceae bacterium]